jgi:hypothetical protein
LKQYKVKKFSSEAKQLAISDNLLSDTLKNFLQLEQESQQKYALGAGLYKLRLASKEGRGKSGGSRSILAFNKDRRVIWLHVFAKNKKDNVTVSELKKLKLLSNILLGISDSEIVKLIKCGELCEVIENV